jgi:hypothetical protein
VSETLAWVRAKSAERRSKRLIASFEEKDKENQANPDGHPSGHPPGQHHHHHHQRPPQTVSAALLADMQSEDAVTASIARGKAILASAESNMDYFDECMDAEPRAKDPKPRAKDAKPGAKPGAKDAAPGSSPAVASQLLAAEAMSLETERLLSKQHEQHERIGRERVLKSSSAKELVYQKMKPVAFDTITMLDGDGEDMAQRLRRELDAAVPDGQSTGRSAAPATAGSADPTPRGGLAPRGPSPLPSPREAAGGGRRGTSRVTVVKPKVDSPGAREEREMMEVSGG